MEHVTPEQLEAFALGTPGLEDPEAFRRHVSACSICARRLEHEARLDLALQQAAREAAGHSRPFLPTRFPRWSVAWRAAAVVVALAGGVWLLFTLRGPATLQHAPGIPPAADLEAPCRTDPMAGAPAWDTASPADYRSLLVAPVADSEESVPGLTLLPDPRPASY